MGAGGRGSMRREHATAGFEAALRGRIERGELRPGDMILSLSEICARYELKRSTAQRALNRLVAAGYLRTVHGRGAFVSDGFRGNRLLVYAMPRSPVRPYLESLIDESSGRAAFTTERAAADVICSPHTDLHGPNSPVPLDPWLRGTPLASPDAWIPKAGDRYRLDGRTYALPVYASPVVLFCNLELLRRAGIKMPADRWNWSEFSSAIEALRPLCDTDVAGVFPFHRPVSFYMSFLAQNEARVFARGGRCGLGTDRALEAISYLRTLRRLSGGATADGRSFVDAFLGGRSAVVMWGGTLADQLSREAPFDWGWVPLPEHRARACGLHSEGLHIGSGSTRRDEAWSFVKTCLSVSSQRALATRGMPFPARSGPAGRLVAGSGPPYQRMLFEMSIGVGEEHRFGAGILRLLNRSLHRVLDPDLSEQAAFALCRETCKILDGVIQARKEERLWETVA